jgi:hypothetical protein
VNDAFLALSSWKNRFDGFRYLGKVVHGHYQDILTASALQLIHHRKPILGRFGLSEIQTQIGGVWADAFLIGLDDIRDRVARQSQDTQNPWIEKFRRGTSLLAQRASDRYPVIQTLLRGPIDMMASAVGHQQMSTAFFDFPSEAAALLDLCTDLFICTTNTDV